MPSSKKREEPIVTNPEPPVDTSGDVPKKSKKKKKERKSTETTVDNTSTTVEAPSPETTTGTEKTKSKKSKRKKEDSNVVESAPTDTEHVFSETTSVESSSETTSVDSDNSTTESAEVDVLLKSLISTVQSRISADKTLLSQLRDLNKIITRERKENSKSLRKLTKGRKKKTGGNKSPGGFTKPTLLSPPMCTFLELPEGTELPRTEVTRRVNTYVKNNNLQNPDNKKQIMADKNLKQLLYLNNTDVLTYFNLQRFMKIHFLKRDPDTGEYASYAPPVSV